MIKKIPFILMSILLFSSHVYTEQKTREEALMDFYDKYKKAEYPTWLKKMLIEKGIEVPMYKFVNTDGGTILNFENLLLQRTDKIKGGSYNEAVLKNLYIMFFEGSQKYFVEYFGALKQIESQAYLSLVIDKDRRHESIINKGTKINESLDNAYASSAFFYYQLSQLLDVITEEKFLINAINLKDKVNKISSLLGCLVDPSDVQSYIIAIKGGSPLHVSHRMAIYQQLESLAFLGIREVDDFSEKDKISKEYEWDNIKKSYKEIKNKLIELISNSIFEEFSPKEKEVFTYVIKTELEEVNKFFSSLDHKLDTTLSSDKEVIKN
ncbi:MAG: hypothetical protein HY934_08150 [Candidatus Firestonebacteria bacterium]|nr:hypothetical protein [Candidatus Firestonebacteria bacterium]